MMETKPKLLKIVSICILLLLVGFTINAQCALTILDSTVGACNDNGTPFDPADDTYPVTVNASVTNSSATQFNVSDGTNSFGPFDYNVGGIVNLPPDGNVYTLTYSDADDVTCNNTTTATQTPCCQIDITTTTFPETFAGGNNGEIQLCIASGVEPFDIVVSPITNASIYENPGTCLHNYIISGLAQDDYAVTITDANGCVTSLTDIEIGGPSCTGFLLSSVGGSSTSCVGAEDGTMEVVLFDQGDATSLTVDVGQGIPPTTFTDLGGDITLENLPAGAYDVAIFDNNGCEVTYLFNPVIVSEPGPITMFVSTVNVSTIGGTDGQATICVSGANSGFTITTDPEIGTITSDNSQCFGQEGFVISELPIGTYEITATDPNGCAETITIIINDPDCPLQIVGLQKTDIDCGGDDTGILDIDISGGMEPFTISLDNGQTFSAPQASTNFLINDLAAGTYGIIVSDVNGCSVSLNSNTIINTNPIITMDPEITHVSNLGLADGSVSMCIEGGVAGYTVSVSPNTGTLSMGGNTGCTGSYTLSDVEAGVYEITVTDDLGCSETFEVEVLEPTCANFTINDVTLDSVSCYGANDGMATIDLNPGGTAPFTYEISGVQTVTTSDNPYTFGGLDNGTIEVFVTDANGCFAPYSTQQGLEEPGTLMSVISIIPPCPGESNGILCLIPEGGTAGAYSYTVLNSDQDEETVVAGSHPECDVSDFYVENLEAGEYHVALMDAKGCMAHTIISITEVMINIVANVTPDCSTVDVGAIDLSLGGGTAPYTVLWSTGDTTEDLTDLSNGTYTVTVTDARGCTQEAPVVVDLLDLELDFNLAATCIEQNAGAIITNVGNGIANYDLIWSGNGASGDILGNTNNLISLSDLDIGNYNITVTDGRGCTAEGSTAVPEYDIVADMVVENTCIDQDNGFVGVIPSTGIPDFNYLWSDGSMGGVLTDQAPGTYSVTVTDLNGCTAVGEGTVEEYELIPTFEVTNVCSGDNSGTIIANVENAEGAIFYNWSNGGVTNPLIGVEAGNYDVTITDALGCSVTGSTSVSEFDSPSATASDDVIIEQGETTTVSVDANGGTSPYNYFWTPSNVSNPTGDATLVAPEVTTTYTVIVTDFNGCTAQDTVLVTVVPEVLVVMPTAFSPNGDTNNEIYEPFIPNADAEVITFQIFDRWGKLIHNDASTPWDGKFKTKNQPVGTYVYVVEYLDLLNRKEMLKGHFNLIR